MCDSSELFESVHSVLSDPSGSDTDVLAKACRCCATDERCVEVIERDDLVRTMANIDEEL